MKTIAYAMGDLSYYQEIKKVLLRGIGIITKGVIQNLAAKYVMTEKTWDQLEKTLLLKWSFCRK
ncbi:MAG TPA: hypothetical protein VKA95_10175 [Nitrososphaeraceae archaeon]|nr:hypothetical protein [Nitrososphaeraceae archaeon]